MICRYDAKRKIGFFLNKNFELLPFFEVWGYCVSTARITIYIYIPEYQLLHVKIF